MLKYRDKLAHDFDVAVTQRRLYTEAKEQSLADAKSMLNLMDKEWWGGRTRAEIAIEVKFATDEINAVLKAVLPKKTESLWLDVVEDVGITINVVRSWIENGSQKALEDANKEHLRKLEEDKDRWLAVVHGLEDYAENEEGLAKSEEAVQSQVASMVRSARSWHAKEVTAKDKADYVERMAQKITDYCSSEPELNISPR